MNIVNLKLVNYSKCKQRNPTGHDTCKLFYKGPKVSSCIIANNCCFQLLVSSSLSLAQTQNIVL